MIEFDPSDAGGAEFLRDLRALLSLPAPARKILLESLQVILASAEEPLPQHVQDVFGKEAVGYGVVESAIRCLDALFRELTPAGMDAEEMASQWEQALPPAEFPWFSRKAFEEVARAISSFATSDAGRAAGLEQAKVDAAVGVMPSFVGIETTVDLRAVVANRPRGRSVQDYVPHIAAITPVISINISVNRGHPQEFSFQLDPAELAYLRDELEATSLEVEKLLKRVQLDSEESEAR